jgi:prepilin-type processing-associated H-X9-DG protein
MMNGLFASNPTDIDIKVSNQKPGKECRIFGKVSDVLRPIPSEAWVFIDESCDSINDGSFWVEMYAGGGGLNYNDYWHDLPANYHGQSGALAFADGHAEIKRWRDPLLVNHMPKTSWNAEAGMKTTVPEEDLRWLQMRTTALK